MNIDIFLFCGNIFLGEVMSLLSKLGEFFIGGCVSKEDELKDKLNFIDEFTMKILESEGVHYYINEENRVEKVNMEELVSRGASTDFANALAKCVKFIRSKALYSNFGVVKFSGKQIKAAYEYVDDIVIEESLKFFNGEKEMVELYGKRICSIYSLDKKGENLLEFANYVLLLNAQIQAIEWLEQHIDSLQMAKRVKVEEIFKELESKDDLLK
jgi:hypothetical protein